MAGAARRRGGYAALTLVACLALLLGAAGWMTATVVRLARAEAQAQVESAHQEDLRLALWRIDSALGPLIAQERARPYFWYAAFFPADGAYGQMFDPPEPAQVLVPSPLLGVHSAFVRLYFQIDGSGVATSPECPDGAFGELARELVDGDTLAAAAARLAEFAPRVSRAVLLAALPPAPDASPTVPTAMPALPPPHVAQAQGSEAPQTESGDAQQSERQQLAQNVREYQARSQTFTNTYVQQQRGGPGTAPGHVREGAFQAIWVGDALLLARRVAVGSAEYVQGCWLDWEALRAWLLAQVGDLLRSPQLLPDAAPAADGREHRLAGLPARLVAAAPAPPLAAALRPDLRFSLILSWVCAVLAAAALTALFLGTLALSERRAAFVSAVTHELRTPLTTFRLYAEMLADGMIRDEQKRRGYLATLQAEAIRLGHLVENVLAYARLERGRTRRGPGSVAVTEMLARLAPRLAARAETAGMALCVESDSVGAARVRADESAVEQILFNLVDNACKYAARATDRRVHVRAACDARRVHVEVRDHGPGLPVARSRLFRPFHKSARDAAESAPGVGLGLALSRRLARAMDGELSAADCRDGARLVLRLRRLT